MRKLAVFLGVLALSALVVPASGGWVQKTDIPSGAMLLGDGNSLFYLSGTTFRQYNTATDTWTDKTSPTDSLGMPGLRTQYIGGDKFVVEGNNSYLYVYDISDDTWTKTPAAPTQVGWLWSQGLAYDSVNDQVMYSWSDGTINPWSETFQTAAYDASTNTWSTPYVYRPDGNSFIYTPVIIGNTLYTNLTGVGSTGGLRTYDLTQAVPFGTGTWGTTSSFDLANDSSKYEQLSYPSGDSAGYTKMLAVYDGKIYITGADWSNAFIVYNPATDTWEYPQEYYDPDIGTYRCHSVQFADGVLYMQQGSEFWAYTIPEPATMSLLGLGGIGLLLRRKK